MSSLRLATSGSSRRSNNPPSNSASPRVGHETPANGTNGPVMNGSGRRPNLSAQPSVSARRVNFDERAAAYGSGRRMNSIGSSSRAMQQQQQGQPFAGLSDSQQTATQSAVSMNHLFAEARREIRRGVLQEKAKQEEAAADGEDHGDKDATGGDVETGDAANATKFDHVDTASDSGGGLLHHHKLDWRSDVQSIREMLEGDKILSCLLICIPFGFFAYYTNFGGDSATFIFNFLAIIPLAWLLGNATEELALRSNQTIGGLLNATFGNAVELIVSVVALNKGMIKLVQTSLLGSILSNCLLVLGMSFALGGLKNKVQMYNQQGAHMLSSLLLLATIALVLPAAFVNSFNPHPTMKNLLMISRVTALIMFVIYLLYLFFQLYTHSEMFSDEASNGCQSEDHSENGDVVKPLKGRGGAGARQTNGDHYALGMNGYQQSDRDATSSDIEEDEVQPVVDHLNELADLDSNEGSQRLLNGTNGSVHSEEEADDDDEADEPTMTFHCAIFLLLLVTLAVAACSEFLVDAINGVTEKWGMSQAFVGIILLPIVGNAAEHATAVTVAMKNKMDLAIGVAIGSSTQIALFLIPFITLLGWVINQPMSLNFSTFETICLVMAVLMVNFLVKNGESNWLQGLMLMAVYFLIAVCFYYHPSTVDDARAQNHQSGWQPSQPQSETQSDQSKF